MSEIRVVRPDGRDVAEADATTGMIREQAVGGVYRSSRAGTSGTTRPWPR